MQNIEKFLFPDSYEIKKHYSEFDDRRLTSYTFQIVDAELDPYEVEISYDGIEINTRDYTHICLASWHINFLVRAYNEFNDEVESYDR